MCIFGREKNVGLGSGDWSVFFLGFVLKENMFWGVGDLVGVWNEFWFLSSKAAAKLFCFFFKESRSICCFMERCGIFSFRIGVFLVFKHDFFWFV